MLPPTPFSSLPSISFFFSSSSSFLPHVYAPPLKHSRRRQQILAEPGHHGWSRQTVNIMFLKVPLSNCSSYIVFAFLHFPSSILLPDQIEVDIAVVELGVDMLVYQSLAFFIVVLTDIGHRDGRGGRTYFSDFPGRQWWIQSLVWLYTVMMVTWPGQSTQDITFRHYGNLCFMKTVHKPLVNLHYSSLFQTLSLETLLWV